MKKIFCIYALALLCLMVISCCGRTSAPTTSLLNLDLSELLYDSMPAKWNINDSRYYSTRLVRADGYNYFEITGTNPGDQPTFGLIFQAVSGLLNGKHVVFSGEIKTEDVTQGYAGLWLRVDGPKGEMLGLENMHDRGISGTTDWQEVSIEMDIDTSAYHVIIGGIFPGKGVASFRNFRLTVDGEKFVDVDATPEPSRREIAWLKQYVYPFDTIDPAAASEKDLQVLDALIGDASVVALGECTHGSREVFQMKHRIMKYLAENEGFDIFSIEANLPESYRLNDYILRGEGDPAELIRGMYFWTWATEEVRDMVEWMKLYHDGGGKIQFTGFDMQIYQGSIAELREAFSGDPATTTLIGELKERLGKYAEGQQGMTNKMFLETEEGLRALAARIGGEIEKLPVDEGRKEWLRRNVAVIDQYIGSDRDWSKRDKMMAANLLWIKDTNPGSRIVTWAHNGHVQKTGNVMGMYLDEALGDDHINIGFATSRGDYRAVSSTGEWIHPLQRPYKGTYEYYFDQLDEPVFILDLKKARQDPSPHGKWLNSRMKFRSIGSMAMREQFSETNLVDDFDYIIYIRDTGHSIALK